MKIARCKYCGKEPFLFTCNKGGKTLYLLHCSDPYCWIETGIYDSFEEACDFWNNGLNVKKRNHE